MIRLAQIQSTGNGLQPRVFRCRPSGLTRLWGALWTIQTSADAGDRYYGIGIRVGGIDVAYWYPYGGNAHGANATYVHSWSWSNWETAIASVILHVIPVHILPPEADIRFVNVSGGAAADSLLSVNLLIEELPTVGVS